VAKREPKTIEEARTLILSLVPNDSRLYIRAHYHDHRNSGSWYQHVSYCCSIENKMFEHKVDVESHTPAQLCRLAIAAVQKALGPLALPAVKPRKVSPAARPKLKGPAQPRLSFR
jgi:hypothetical protein